MTTKKCKPSSSSGRKETKGSSLWQRTLQKAKGSVSVAPEWRGGLMDPFIPNPRRLSMDPQSYGVKTGIPALRASTLTAEKEAPKERKHGSTWPNTLADRLSEKSLPEALCCPAAPCWLCRYVRCFLLMEKLRGIRPPKDRRTRREDLDRRSPVDRGFPNGQMRRNGPRDRRYPNPV